ncbi:hypothetical protein FRC11_010319, partial [Ceratobasidium sp. 423]
VWAYEDESTPTSALRPIFLDTTLSTPPRALYGSIGLASTTSQIPRAITSKTSQHEVT